MRGSNIDEAMVKAVMCLRKEGLSFAKISLALGKPVASVYRWYLFGIGEKKRKKVGRPISPNWNKIKQVTKLRNDGMSFAKIANKLGHTEMSVRAWYEIGQGERMTVRPSKK